MELSEKAQSCLNRARAQGWTVTQVSAVNPTLITWEFSKELNHRKEITQRTLRFRISSAPDALAAAVLEYAQHFNRDTYAKELYDTMKPENWTTVLDCLYEATSMAQGEIFNLASALRIPDVEEAVAKWLDEARCWCKEATAPEYFGQELSFDYSDTGFERKALARLACSDCPTDAFSDMLYDTFAEAERDAEKELDSDAISAVEEVFGETMDDISREAITEYLREHFSFYPPHDHYINQLVPVTIVLDTGDAGADFTLNNYPEFGTGEAGQMDDRASLVWLAKSQGYTKKQMEEALAQGDIKDPHGFLETCRQEMSNACSQVKPVVLLVKMTVGQMLALRELKLAAAQGATELGTITLRKDTEVGICDIMVNGAGGPLEIELEQDVTLPINLIDSAYPDCGLEHPDCGYEYSILDIYGAPESIYRETLVDFQVPEEITKQHWFGLLLPDNSVSQN